MLSSVDAPPLFAFRLFNLLAPGPALAFFFLTHSIGVEGRMRGEEYGITSWSEKKSTDRTKEPAIPLHPACVRSELGGERGRWAFDVVWLIGCEKQM